ncbi:hypothetical protein GJAV_G00223790 [Gymnothorax javanicus]|nr:hypothetical protein GJAV_G00223790 [Gymnothorax javanicus]
MERWSGSDRNGGNDSESPDSIIAKINQRLVLLSKQLGDKDSQESPFSFEAFESYMTDSKEKFRYGEETGRAGESVAKPQPTATENHFGKGGAKRGKGEGSGGVKTKDPYMNFDMRPTPPHPASSSERLSARWNELNYMGPHAGMGPHGGMGSGGAPGRVPSFYPSGRHLGPPDYHCMAEPLHSPDYHHSMSPHGMMGGRYPSYTPYGPQVGPGAWQRLGKKRMRAEKEGKKGRGGSKKAKKRRRTESEEEAEEPELKEEEKELEEEDDDNVDGEPEEGTIEEPEKKLGIGGEEEVEEVPKKKSRGRKSKEKQQRERSKLLFACSLCKFKTPDETEINSHLESRLHSEVIGFLEENMPEGAAKFLQEYTAYRNKKILKKRQEVFEKDGRPVRVDPFIDLAKDEFCRRIEAAHCTACDMVIPGQRHLLQQHLASKEHQRYRQALVDQYKMSSVQIAKSILSNKDIREMMEQHSRGEDPFTEEADDQETQRASAAPAGEGTTEKGEGTDGEGGAVGVAEESSKDAPSGGGLEGNGEGEGVEVGEEEGFSEDDLGEEEEDEDEENPMA